MYLLFRYHNITPGQYYGMGYGEKKGIAAVMRYEIDTSTTFPAMLFLLSLRPSF